MAYIGINPNQNLAQRFTEVFTGNGVQTVYTLPVAPGSTNAVDVSVGGVDQIGGINFSVSNNTLTFLTGAPPAGALIKVLFTAEINSGDFSRTRTTRKSFTTIATAGQTVIPVPGGYDPGQVDVYVNGVKLILGVDFDGTSGTVITLTDAASVGDEIDIIAYGVFYISGVVNKTGDTMTGPLVVPAGATGSQVPRFSDVQTAITNSFQSVSSINGGQLAGMRNKIINGNFQVNQRGYVSGTNVGAANTYTLDRWRVVTSGQNITFTASGNGNLVTAPAGGLEQVIEGINIEGGTYVLSWTGTATATVNGTTRAKGESFTLTANTNATVRFSSGTVGLVQLEPGTVATPFEHRPYTTELQLCQRYYETDGGVQIVGDNVISGNATRATWFYKVTKRAAATVIFGSGFNGSLESNGSTEFVRVVATSGALPSFGTGAVASVEL